MIAGLFKNKKTMKKLFIILSAALVFGSCTQNSRARNFGGTEVVKLNPGERFVNATWKDANLWIVTQDQNGSYHFREKSSYGWVEGEVIINEIKQ